MPRVEPTVAAVPAPAPTGGPENTVPPASPPPEPEPLPAASPRRVPPALAIGLAAVGALALGLIGWAVVRNGDAAESGSAPAAPGAPAVAAPQPEENAPSPTPAAPSAASAEALKAVDAALEAGERGDASTLLKPLVLAYPNDPDVLWRAGLSAGDPARHSTERATYFLQAIRNDPERIKNGSVKAELLKDLARKTVPEPLIDLVIEHGKPIEAVWTKALLGRKRGALAPAQRARLIAATEPADTWNVQEQQCLDLWQAPETSRPCATFRAALDAIETAPSGKHKKSVKHAPVPTTPGKDDPAEACEGLEAHRDAVLEALADAKGSGTFVPADFADKVPTKGKRSRRNRFGGLFR